MEQRDEPVGAMVKRAVGKVIRATRRVEPHSTAAISAARRAAFVARVKATAAWHGATVDLVVAPDARIGRDVRVTVEPWTHNVLHVGPGSLLGDSVLIQLKGGTVLLGDGVLVRRGTVLNVSGRLECEGDNLISWACVVHCSNDIRIGRRTIIGEYTTLADSVHFFTAPEEDVYHNVRVGSVAIGRNTWVCAKATLGRGADVGSHCIVGSNAVVTSEVPDGSLVSGVPATVRPLQLPWATERQARAGS